MLVTSALYFNCANDICLLAFCKFEGTETFEGIFVLFYKNNLLVVNMQIIFVTIGFLINNVLNLIALIIVNNIILKLSVGILAFCNKISTINKR